MQISVFFTMVRYHFVAFEAWLNQAGITTFIIVHIKHIELISFNEKKNI